MLSMRALVSTYFFSSCRTTPPPVMLRFRAALPKLIMLSRTCILYPYKGRTSALMDGWTHGFLFYLLALLDDEIWKEEEEGEC